MECDDLGSRSYVATSTIVVSREAEGEMLCGGVTNPTSWLVRALACGWGRQSFSVVDNGADFVRH
jgi:hypothetical protein